jgi:hypothetical protein
LPQVAGEKLHTVFCLPRFRTPDVDIGLYFMFNGLHKTYRKTSMSENESFVCKSVSSPRETCNNVASRNLVRGRLEAMLQVAILYAGDLKQCCKSESCPRET